MAKHVLLVEDEANIREAIGFLLTREGWQVTVQEDGHGAVDAIRAARPNLVILDYMLPGKTGLEIVSDLRADPDFADLPVLMLTARGQTRDREQAERLGVSRFMTKPFSNTEVLNAVRDLVYVSTQKRESS